MKKDILAESGKIKSLEKTFLTLPFLKKLTGTPDIYVFLSELERSFYPLPKTFNNAKEVISFFDAEREKLLQEEKKSLSYELVCFFAMKSDFHNLRVFVKELFGEEQKETYSFSGMVEPFTMKEAFMTGNTARIPVILKKTVREASKLESTNVNDYFLFLQKRYYRISRKLIESQHSEFLNEYIKIETDFINLSTFILKKSCAEKIQKKELLEYGKIRPEKYMEEETLWKSVNSEYPGIKTPMTEENFEKEKDAAIINFLKQARSIPYGIEVIFSYYVAREKEINNLQRLLIGKFYNVPPEILKNWIITPYTKTSTH